MQLFKTLLLTATLTAATSLAFAAPTSNIICNPHNPFLVHMSASGSATTNPSKKQYGVYINIPSSCTKNQVCNYKLSISSANNMIPKAQNNNAETTLINGKNYTKNIIFYAYYKQNGAGQCIYSLLPTTKITITSQYTNTDKSAKQIEALGYTFN